MLVALAAPPIILVVSRVQDLVRQGLHQPAEVDARYAPPIHLSGTVEAIVEGDINAQVEVVVRVGSVYVIVTEKRKPYHKEADFTRLGLKPRKTDIVVVKIGYLEPELYAMKADYERSGLEDFELFWDNKPVNTLYKAGLLQV